MADLTGADIIKLYGNDPAGTSSSDGTPPAPLTGADIIKRYQEADAATAAAQPPPESTGSMFARKLGLGARDVLEGTVGPLYDIARQPINWLGGAVGLPPVKPFSENLTDAGLPTPQTPFERGASSVIQPVAGTLVGQGVGHALTTAASPVAQAVGEALTSQPVTQAVSAGVGGATTQATGSPTAGIVAGMATPFAMSGAGMAGRALENGVLGGISKSDAELGALAKDKYNIPVGAPDLTDNAAIRIGSDQAGKLPFSGVRPSAEAKQAAWQGAIGKEMGEPDAPKFTPDVMNHAAGRIGSVFDGVAAHTSIPPAETTQLSTDLDGVIAQAKRVLQPGEIAPLQTQVDDIKQLIADNKGTIGGDAYQRLTNSKSVLSRLERQNSNTADFAGDVRDHLDDAFARSAAPADQDALQQARYQYRVMRTVDQLAAGSRGGDISPDAFMQKVLTASRKFDAPLGGMAYTGGGNIGELARIGKLMRAPPQTGTADRAAINLLAAGSIGLPATITSNPWSLLGVPAALAANRGAGAYLRSGSLANRLIENATAGQPNPFPQALPTSGVVGLGQEYQRARQQPNLLNPGR